MRSSSRRKLAWGSGIAGAIVVAALLFTSRGRLVEEWRLSRLISSLTSRDVRVRLGAVEGLSRIDSPRTIPALCDVVHDPEEDPAIRRAALDAVNRVSSRLLRTSSWERLWGGARPERPDD